MPLPPMEASRSESIPEGSEWAFEPKWDGFRAIVFRSGDDVVIQSKSSRPLGRYFPELVEIFRSVRRDAFVLDGEIIIESDGAISFDDLLLRLHPAESRVKKLAREIPARFIAFDLLCNGRGEKNDFRTRSYDLRRAALEKESGKWPSGIDLTPSTTDRETAKKWFEDLSSEGLDGVMAKLRSMPYRSGERDGMVKVKNFRSVDCVVGGYRLRGDGTLGSLLLGLYDDEDRLQYVGHTSALPEKSRKETQKLLDGLRDEPAFEGRVPEAENRWTQKKSNEWVPLRPDLVCEVRYDHYSQGRFRHGSKFMRWRPDKAPEQCRLEQVTAPLEGKLLKKLIRG
ncbi:MAG: ATP-dependent DNA ligase [Acidobacteria bacterium]|nr:ATP-dependent DNA ligase [Acidobacteriota bacterium]